MENWINILVGALSGTSLIGAVGSIVFFRETRRLKRNEVKQSNVDVQRQEMELADLYKDKMLEVLELLEQVSAKQDSGSGAQDKILAQLSSLSKQVTDIVTYLNGDYQKYLQRLHAAEKPRKARRKAE